MLDRLITAAIIDLLGRIAEALERISQHLDYLERAHDNERNAGEQQCDTDVGE